MAQALTRGRLSPRQHRVYRHSRVRRSWKQRLVDKLKTFMIVTMIAVMGSLVIQALT